MKKYIHVADCVKPDELVLFTQELVRINSVFDPEKKGANEEAAARYLAELLIKEGSEVRFETSDPGRPNVITFLRGKKPEKIILFEGHTDAVAAENLELLNDSPFGAKFADGRICDRGACLC